MANSSHRSPALRLSLSVLIGLALIAGCTSQSSSPSSSPNSSASSSSTTSSAARRIAVIPKSMSHVFWTSVEKGAKQAGEQQKVEILWKAPLKESDRRAQIDLVQQFTADGVSGIVLAPLDSKALVVPVKAAKDAGIPVVIIDSGLDAEAGQDFDSFVGTNNRLGGTLGGQELGRILDGKGKVVLLRYMAGSASTTEREEGFLAAVKEHAAIEIISDNRFAGTTSGEAQTAALNMMDVIREADAVFCPNESSTDGMLQALRKEGLAGKIKFVGFDASPPLVEALRMGEIYALVVQNPMKMGAMGVETIVSILDGKNVPQNVDTGVAVVTRENMDQPDIRPLLP